MGGSTGDVSVLHVDDDRDFADLTASYLEREDEDFIVETASSASEALERLSEETFDCVVSDYDMPDTDGIEFLETVRETWPDLPFVLFTGAGSEEVAGDAITKGATDYLRKKPGTEQYALLANRIRNAVEQYRASRRAANLDRIHTLVNEVNQALIRASSREEIATAVCEIITDDDPYRCAWVGDHDPATGSVVPETAACDEELTLDPIAVAPDVDRDDGHPAARAVRTRELAVTQEIPANPAEDSWRTAALDRGYRSGAAIPLVYSDTLHGVLAMYADRTGAFDDRERTLLTELGDDIAHALHSIETQARLREEHDRLTALFENTPDPVVKVSFDGKTPVIDGVNATFEDLFGFEATSATGRSLTDLLVPASERDEFRSLRDEVVDGSAIETEVRRRTTDGQRQFWVRVIPIDGDDDPDGAYVWYTDVTERKRRQQELERERDRFSAIFEAMPDPIAQVHFQDGHPVVRDVNSAFADVFGYDATELEGESLNDAIVPEDRRAEARRIDEAFDATGEVEREIERLAADGRRTFMFRGARVELPDGTREGIGVYTDITDRKEHERALAALHDAANRLEAADSEAEVYEHVVEAAEEILAFDFVSVDVAEDGQLVMKAMSEENAEEYYPAVSLDTDDNLGARTYRRGETILADDLREHDVAPADPEYRSALTVPLGEFGTVQAGSREVAAFDETDRELAELLAAHAAEALERLAREADLRRTTERLEAILDNTTALIYVKDREGRYTLVNDRFAEVQGMDEADLLGTTDWDIQTDEHAAEIRENDRKALEKERPIEVEERTRRDGEERTYYSVKVPLYEEGEEPTAVCGISTDITDLKRREEELRRENERLERFASVVSHDLRNPLTVAAGELELAREKCESPHLDEIAGSLDRMETIIENVLTMARQGRFVEASELEPVELASVAGECWYTVETADADLEVATTATVTADADRLQRVLENLFRNAIDHGGGDVTITVGDIDGAGFYVADDGPGIPPDDREQVFESGYSTTDDGTGFGLAIVRELVDAHDWTVSVTESAAGGARFEVTSVDLEG
ncbi:MAG: PAS domain S-box-containing protein [Halobacteriales archaeon]|jgi:PAS domain S-box-containing protein